MSDSGSRQKRNDLELKRLRDKQAAIDEIRQNYARYGDRVVLAILQHNARTSGLRGLVGRLPIRNAPWSDDQLHHVILRFINTEGVGRFMEFAALDNKPSSKPASAAGQPDASPAPAAHKPAGAARSAVQHDRRSGQDRRSGKDRRNEVEMIYKNKRFGKDRRSGRDRRRKQDPPPWPAKPDR